MAAYRSHIVPKVLTLMDCSRENKMIAFCPFICHNETNHAMGVTDDAEYDQ